MLLLDALLRFPTVVGFLFFALLLVRDEDRTLATMIAVSLSLSLSALFLSNAPTPLALPHQPLFVAKIIAAPNLALMWWFGQSLLDDDFSLSIPQWAGFVLLTVNNLPLLSDQIGFGMSLGISFGFAVPIHLAFLAITGWRNDMSESRRHLRVYLLLWLLVGLSIILMMEYLETLEHTRSLIRMALTFPAVWLIILVSTQIRASGSPISPPTKIWKPPAMNNAQSAAFKRLLHAIESEKVYLDPALSMSDFSKRCGVTEYQMRKLINEHLGFTNFSIFLNNYRINEAKLQLIQSEDSITSIALSCGFQTLSTFNRAFRKIEGKTPTVYRQNERTPHS